MASNGYGRWLWWCLSLVVLAPVLSYPFSWLLPDWTPFRSALHLPVATLATAAGLLLFVGAPFRARSGSAAPVASRSVLPQPLLACLLALVVATAFSPFPAWSASALPGSVTALGVLLLGMAVPAEKVRSLLWWWIGAAVIVAGNGLLRLGIEPEFVSTIGNRNVLAAYLAATVCLILGLLGTRSAMSDAEAGRARPPGAPYRPKKQEGARIVLIAVVFSFIPALHLCQSRSAWLALAAAGIVSLLLGGRNHRRAGIVLAVAAIAGGILWGARVASADARPVIWSSTLRMIADRPVAGHGLGLFTAVYPAYRDPEYFTRPKVASVTDHPHNELLHVAAEQGFIGLAATVWLWGTCLWFGARVARENLLYRGVFAAVIVFLVHGMLDIGLRAPPTQPVFWLLLGVLAGGQRRLSAFAPNVLMRSAAIIVAVWLLWFGVWRPVAADWWEREAQVASRIGQPARAIEAAERALEIQPYRLRTRYFLAGLLARAPSADARAAAIEQCELLRQWAPDYADVNLNLAELYRVSGLPEKARPLLERAAQLNPHDERVRAALASLPQSR